MELKILYEDKYITAVLKEPGMLSQSDNDEDITSLLPYKAHIINRLDRPVGGIVLLAKDKLTATKLTELMQSGGISKHYLAVVCGECENMADLTDYLMVNKRLNLTKVVNRGNMSAKEARLSYHLIEQKTDTALIDVTLYTGRHHQIRAQLSHHGIPIWGDTKYNPDFKHKRGVLPALFACCLTFVHPFTAENIKIIAIPDYGKFTDFCITKEIFK